MPSIQNHRALRGPRARAVAVVSSIAMAGVVAGCASTSAPQPLASSASGDLQGKTIVQTERTELPNFTAMTPGKAGFALIGRAAMNSAGNAVINENKVADPALAIGAALSDEMGRRYRAQTVSPRLSVDSDDVAAIATRARGKARYVMDVKTVDWSSAYFVSDWGKYYVNYSAQSRLIDVDKQAVVAQASCKYTPSDGPAGYPSYEELTGNGAAVLKSTLTDIGKRCAKEMAAAMFAGGAQ